MQTTRQYTVVVLLASMLFAVSDYQFLGEHFNMALALRCIVVGVEVALLMYLPRFSTRNAFSVVAAGMILYNFLIVYLGTLGASQGYYAYQQGTLVIIVFCCTLFQAPFLYSAVVAITCWASYLLMVWLKTNTPADIVINNLFVFGIAVVMGLMAVLHRERYLIAYFLQSQELEQQRKQAAQRAHTDALTQLPNRHALTEHLAQYQESVTAQTLVIMIDLDDFKKLNDEHGHAAGDLALQQVAAQLITLSEEEQGFLARYGGEEFVLFFAGVSRTKAERLALRLLQAVADIQHAELPALSASVGAYLSGREPVSVQEAMEKADRALLKAKQRGKRCVQFAE